MKLCFLLTLMHDTCLCCPPCRWMEACLDEELPPTTELEEGLRNGVYLAKLGNFFAPQTVSLKKIYDREQTRYKVKTCRCLCICHLFTVICYCEPLFSSDVIRLSYRRLVFILDTQTMSSSGSTPWRRRDCQR